MALNVSSLAGGGTPSERFRSSSGISIPTGSSGTLISLTPPSGQRVRLSILWTSASNLESGITVTVGGNVVVSGGTLDDDNAGANGNAFTVGPRTSNGRPPMLGAIDEVIEVIKDSGTTGTSIEYAYEFVE